MEIAYVNVFVKNIELSVAFYQYRVGLTLLSAAPEFGFASFAAGSVRLGLAVPGPGKLELIGRHTGIGFSVPDLEKAYRRLSADGVKFTMLPAQQPWGGFMALFTDPDGNIFYLDQDSAEHS